MNHFADIILKSNHLSNLHPSISKDKKYWFWWKTRDNACKWVMHICHCRSGLGGGVRPSDRTTGTVAVHTDTMARSTPSPQQCTCRSGDMPWEEGVRCRGAQAGGAAIVSSHKRQK